MTSDLTLLVFDQRVDPSCSTPGESAGTVRLDFEHRQKRRARCLVTTGPMAGRTVALDLPRGIVLRNQDRLRGSAHGYELVVQAAIQQLCEVRSPDWYLISRIAYHLGNRHVPLALQRHGDEGVLRLELDHVLEQMIQGLGGEPRVVNAAFDPESGAYHSHGDGHGGADHLPGAVESSSGGDRDYDRRHSPIIHDFLDPNAPPVQR